MLVLLQLAVECVTLAPVLRREELPAEDTAELGPKVAKVRMVVANELRLLDELLRADGTDGQVLLLNLLQQLFVLCRNKQTGGKELVKGINHNHNQLQERSKWMGIAWEGCSTKDDLQA